MPREGVPYPERLLCSVRCELKNIWAALSGKLHSVNGVEGDGAGNVNIVSGDAAVIVTTDPSLNQIEVSLDQSQLPAAAVSSVNGETGAVVLDASEIDFAPGQTVRQTLINTANAVTQNTLDIASEATARQNADSALQMNINASNLRISNIENAISTDPDPDTIGLRDSNGRLKAADPASGATDKTLTTANWISQSGAGAPNNLIHTTGNEIKNGSLVLTKGRDGYPIGWHNVAPITTPANYYSIFARITPINNGHYATFDFFQNSNTANEAGRLLIHCWRGAINPVWLYRKSKGGNSNLSSPDNIVVLDDGTYLYLAWKRTGQYGGIMSKCTLSHHYGTIHDLDATITWFDNQTAIVTNDLSAYTIATPTD